jgi:hypothetical protein
MGIRAEQLAKHLYDNYSEHLLLVFNVSRSKKDIIQQNLHPTSNLLAILQHLSFNKVGVHYHNVFVNYLSFYCVIDDIGYFFIFKFYKSSSLLRIKKIR